MLGIAGIGPNRQNSGQSACIRNETTMNTDHHRALSCISQIINGSPVTQSNAELLRHNSETLLGDAIRYGEFGDTDLKALCRMRKSLEQAFSYTTQKRAETVDNVRNMLTRFF